MYVPPTPFYSYILLLFWLINDWLLLSSALIIGSSDYIALHQQQQPQQQQQYQQQQQPHHHHYHHYHYQQAHQKLLEQGERTSVNKGHHKSLAQGYQRNFDKNQTEGQRGEGERNLPPFVASLQVVADSKGPLNITTIEPTAEVSTHFYTASTQLISTVSPTPTTLLTSLTSAASETSETSVTATILTSTSNPISTITDSSKASQVTAQVTLRAPKGIRFESQPLLITSSALTESNDPTVLPTQSFSSPIIALDSNIDISHDSNKRNINYPSNVGDTIPDINETATDRISSTTEEQLQNNSNQNSSNSFKQDNSSSPPDSNTNKYNAEKDIAGYLNASRENATVSLVLPSVQTVLVSVILLIVIIGTIIGNVLVCIAVCMVRKLRRPCNYLLVSLALSDLCVAVLVMPIALLYEVIEKWNFGPVVCDVWVSFDVLCCTASILNLCAISVDRYLAITKPLEYGVKRTPRRMMICVALVWLAAACISLPPLLILGNEHVDEHGQPTCVVCQNFAYQIYATLGSFYIPLAVMLFVYYQIFKAARRIVLEEKRAQTHLQNALNGTASSQAPPSFPLRVDCKQQKEQQPPRDSTQDDSYEQQPRGSSCINAPLSYSAFSGLSSCPVDTSGSSGLLGSSPHHNKKLRFQLAKEKKASTTLGIIMSAFTICWLPFFILALIRPFVESESVHVPATLSSLFLWLGYANSLLNPIIYATLNRDFRKPFQEILYFRCSSLNAMMRENYYQDQYGEPPSQRVILGDDRHGARESFL